MSDSRCPATSWTMMVGPCWAHRGYQSLTVNCHDPATSEILHHEEYLGLAAGELLDVIDAYVSLPHIHADAPERAETLPAT